MLHQKGDLPWSPFPAGLGCRGYRCKQRTGCVWGDLTQPCLSLQGAGPALLIQDIWTLLLSFRNKRLRANCLAACSKMLCTTTKGRAVHCTDGSAEAAEVSRVSPYYQDPQTQPPPGFYCPVCWGIASREFLSPSYCCWKCPPPSRLARCRLSPWLVLCPQRAHGPLPI